MHHGARGRDGAIKMAHGLARWSFLTVNLLLFGPGAFAQTDQPLPGQPPMCMADDNRRWIVRSDLRTSH